MQSSTAELITGLVQLVPLTNTTQLSQEAMEVSIKPSHSLNAKLIALIFMTEDKSTICKILSLKKRCFLVFQSQFLNKA